MSLIGIGVLWMIEITVVTHLSWGEAVGRHAIGHERVGRREDVSRWRVSGKMKTARFVVS